MPCEVILQFMLKASQNPEYGVRIEALAVWIACAGQPDCWGVVQKLLTELVPVLVTNMVYSNADYMILEASQADAKIYALFIGNKIWVPRRDQKQGPTN